MLSTAETGRNLAVSGDVRFCGAERQRISSSAFFGGVVIADDTGSGSGSSSPFSPRSRASLVRRLLNTHGDRLLARCSTSTSGGGAAACCSLVVLGFADESRSRQSRSEEQVERLGGGERAGQLPCVCRERAREANAMNSRLVLPGVVGVSFTDRVDGESSTDQPWVFQSNPCAICLSGMGAGGGQAIFTAECSHTFHFQCISANVAHGNLACPLCNAQWRQLPFVLPAQPPATPPTLPLQPPPQRRPMHRVQPPVQFQPPQPEVFDDDDEIVQPPPPTENQSPPQEAGEATTPGGRGTLVVRTHTEYPAIARGASHESFAALVHVQAPGMITTEEGDDGAQRALLDLVTVLDVSGSMAGEKLALLKQAMGFVVDNLGPGDRLSVVSFSSSARRVTRLLRMSDAGKSAARTAVESLAARGGTNIADGLRVAAKVLGERRHRNAVASVILLSDGQDNHTMATTRPRAGASAAAAPNYEALVPASFTTTNGAPVHTFGFGSDHDAAAMHVVAEATGGTFSFIENQAVVQDAFAQCIGGLLTVVVQDARVAVACVDPGVRVVSVRSGRYESRVDDDERAASVRVGELYADEERRFLLFLAVPPVVVAEALDGETTATTLIRVSCSYRDAAGCEVTVTADDAVVTRPEHVVAAAHLERSVEVARERARVEATDDIASARAAAERGAYDAAAEILERRQRAVAESEAAASMQALGRELQEMRARVASEEEYARSGRAMMLSGFNMHSRQRANSRQVNWASNGATPSEERSYSTPAMRAMLLRSRMARAEASAEQQQPPPDAGEAVAGSSGPQ
ncbi:hypothetical protein PR202_gb18561 [Eleusine coracana subsp. coracana]|uniref:Uncharacterized protein n=1 Tax=Eleusine coracana subsp. coracana TaxID=191504 RepID=A0AAV5F7H1_ELECO|nr:hypothetical protein PR202_gb18561 [Eleusine coracana subsp. coracana]